MACGFVQLPTRQLEALQNLVTKHIQDPALNDIAGSSDFTVTSLERGVQRWEHAHIVAALDVINSYQRDRRARFTYEVAGCRPSLSKQFADDPRTRLCELLKRWFRGHAGAATIEEEDVRSISGLCRDVLNHPQLFPSRNPRSFMRTISEVYEHTQWQLREVLERDRTCAELTQRAMSLSKNLISDVVAYLLLAPTDLRQTDAIPSLEVVSLWNTLPADCHPMPNRSDPSLQKIMREAWRTRCGAVLACVLSTPWCVRLFDGCGAEDEAVVAMNSQLDNPAMGNLVLALIAEARTDFDHGRFKNSGLAGIFRSAKKGPAREHYLAAAEGVFDLTYLLGAVLIQFHRISDGLGDYGTVRVAPWLHPFLEAVCDKVQLLKGNLEQLNDEVESTYVLARARGVPVAKPAPTDRMCARAHACLDRALTGRENHAQSLLQVLEELRARSAPERLPHVIEGLGNACLALRNTFASPEFSARAGLMDVPDWPKISGPPRVSLPLEDGSSCIELAETDATNPDTLPTLLARGDMAANGKASLLPPAVTPLPSILSSSPLVDSNVRASDQARHESVSTPPSTTRAEPRRSPMATLGHALNNESVNKTWRQRVHRLAPPKFGVVADALRRHDQRIVQLAGKNFLIYEPGSEEIIKSIVDIADVEICGLYPGAALSLSVLRRSGNEDGIAVHKAYDFEFESHDIAKAFRIELLRRGAQTRSI